MNSVECYCKSMWTRSLASRFWSHTAGSEESRKYNNSLSVARDTPSLLINLHQRRSTWSYHKRPVPGPEMVPEHNDYTDYRLRPVGGRLLLAGRDKAKKTTKKKQSWWPLTEILTLPDGSLSAFCHTDIITNIVFWTTKPIITHSTEGGLSLI